MDSDFYVDMAVAVLLRLVKDPTKNTKWRRALLKIFRAIAAANAQDIEFRSAAKQEFK